MSIKQSISRFFGIETGSKPQIVNITRPRMLWNMLIYFLFRKFNLIKVPYKAINLMVEISTVCNFKCPSCERELYKNELGGLPKENVKLENIKKLTPILPYIYSVYLVSGLGEPFCNKEFWDIVRFFKKFKIKTGYFSNASLITEEQIKRTFDEKVNNITISIDTHIKEKYEKIKKGAEYENMLNIVKLFRKYKNERNAKNFEIGLNYIFRSDNYEDIIDFLDLAKELEVDFVLCTSLITHIESEVDKSFFVVDIENKRKIFDQTKEKAKRLNLGLKLPKLEPTWNNVCDCLWRHMSIFYDGTVCACPYFRTDRDFYYHVKDKDIVCEKRQVSNNILGNYLKQNINEIWNGPKIQHLRKGELNKKYTVSPCDNCYYKYKCH